ncbi:MAG: aldo/keto reductase, partial [Treponema sp.]|nr:aldo/keto reductase [Treponema sp.]
LEQYDFDGKTVIPFCTSNSSGVGSSASTLSALCPGANFLAGRRFSNSSSSGDVSAWLTEIGIK